MNHDLVQVHVQVGTWHPTYNWIIILINCQLEVTAVPETVYLKFKVLDSTLKKLYLGVSNHSCNCVCLSTKYNVGNSTERLEHS